ncbi:potassium channel family protein [Cytobacillus sp. FSL R5-0569]|nr:potassium channel family protein [Cytobacillus sp. OWB-43]
MLFSRGVYKMPHYLYSYFTRLPLVFRILIMALMTIILFGGFVHLLEPNSFPTWFDGIWWAVITASTVGYGDFVPHSVVGRLAGIVLVLTGAGFIASYFVALSTAAVAKQNDYIQGNFKFKDRDHIIVIGWNARSREILKTICSYVNSVPVTLIDETLEENPLPHQNLHFVKGNPQRDDVLMKASVMDARQLIITADQNKDEHQADMHSILTLIAVKGMNPSLPCIVEILTTEQMKNAKRAGADEIVQTNLLTSFVMISSLTSREMVTAFLSLLRQIDQRRLGIEPILTDHIGANFRDVSISLMNEDILILGIKRGEEMIIHPPHPFSLQAEDLLITIKN